MIVLEYTNCVICNTNINLSSAWSHYIVNTTYIRDEELHESFKGYKENESNHALGYVCVPCYNELMRPLLSDRERYSLQSMLGYFNCQRCQGEVSIHCMRQDDNEIVCIDCFSINHWSCYHCNEWFNSDIEYYEGDTIGAQFCEDCWSERQRRDFIKPYDYIPNNHNFYKEDNEYRNLLYFGIELEIEANDNDKYLFAAQLPDFVYAKSDGSLYNGFEIVSHPTSYRWLMKNKEKWNELLCCRKRGYRSFNTDTCGMHVHMSKNAFGNHHLYKFMKLFYNNPQLIYKVSQRKTKKNLDRWAQLKPTVPLKKVAKYKSMYNHDNRYTAISLYNHPTIEVRVFRGTLHPPSFWKNIEFCKCVYEFSYNNNEKYMTELNFRKYVKINKSEFPNLYSFLYSSESKIETEKLMIDC